MSYNDIEGDNLIKKTNKKLPKAQQPKHNGQQEEAAAGTPRSRDHCESVQLGGQATAAGAPKLLATVGTSADGKLTGSESLNEEDQ